MLHNGGPLLKCERRRSTVLAFYGNTRLAEGWVSRRMRNKCDSNISGVFFFFWRGIPMAPLATIFVPCPSVPFPTSNALPASEWLVCSYLGHKHVFGVLLEEFMQDAPVPSSQYQRRLIGEALLASADQRVGVDQVTLPQHCHTQFHNINLFDIRHMLTFPCFIPKNLQQSKMHPTHF